MRLLAGDRVTYAIRIHGYEFDGWNDVDDLNWLQIEVSVSGPTGGWQRVDPALQTWDVRRLISWLRTEELEPQRLEFLEPSLVFERPSPNVLRMELDYGLRPPGSRQWADDGSAEVPVIIEFSIPPNDLAAAADALDAQLAAYPERR